MNDRNSIIGKVDWPLLLMYFALVIIGWLSIYSAGMGGESHAIYDLSHFSGKQMVWIGISLAVGFVILLLDAKFFDAFSIWIYAIVVFMLLVVLVYGKATKGATSWIDFGGGVKLQPSEFAKLGTALALAHFLGGHDVDLRKRNTRLMISWSRSISTTMLSQSAKISSPFSASSAARGSLRGRWEMDPARSPVFSNTASQIPMPLGQETM